MQDEITPKIQLPQSLSGVGLGLRHRHFRDFIEGKPEVPWLEVHTENFFAHGSTAAKYLLKIREDYPLSLHSVGLSLGTAQPDEVWHEHIQRVKATVERFDPALVSDHVSWSGDAGGTYLPDLLPVPYTEEALSVMVENVQRVQEALGRQILMENPSSYLCYRGAEMTEWEFIRELNQRSGCGLLLDVNNIYVSAHNHGFDAQDYLAALPVEPVQEIHLAGYAVQEVEGKDVYIDTHGAPVYEEVWDLYSHALQRFGAIPTLIEWDSDVPELAQLLTEKTKAEQRIALLQEEVA